MSGPTILDARGGSRRRKSKLKVEIEAMAATGRTGEAQQARLRWKEG
jgi:hypothetical protein